jgi:predicted ribosomally synthesized peptide with SipW-like signal peptide
VTPTSSPTGPRGRRLGGLPLRAIAAGVALLALGGAGTFSALSSTTSNTGNTITAGTLAIGDNDSGSAMFTLPNVASTTATATRCIRVTNTGTLPFGALHLYAANVANNTLASHLTLTIERGAQPGPGSPTFSTCTGFTPDAGAAGAVYSGTIAGLPTSYATGVNDADLTPWTPGGFKDYRFTVGFSAVADGDHGQTATFDAIWEARD